MTRELCFLWGDDQVKAGDSAFVLTDNPLAEPPLAWFEDYFDPVARFPDVYRRAKEVSTGWTAIAAVGKVSAVGVPLLESFEHQIHSFWMQVERDREVAAQLLKRESPASVRLSGRPIDITAIASCRFDPGLFECGVALEAAKRGIAVSGGPPRPRFGRSVPTTLHVASMGIADRLLAPRLQGAGALLLATPSALQSLTPQGIAAFADRGFGVVSTSIETSGPFPTLAGLCSRRVSVRERLSLWSKGWRSFRGISPGDWEEAFPGFGEVGRQVAKRILADSLWAEGYRLLLLSKLMAAGKPVGLLVLYDHGLHEAGIVTLARSEGIPTVVLQHGLANRFIPGYLPLKADRFACWGEAERELNVGLGMEERRIAVTGHPRFDDQWTPGRPGARSQGPLRVLVATQGVFASVDWSFALTRVERIIRELAPLGEGRRGHRFTLRLHPNETVHPSAVAVAERSGIRLTKGLPLREQFEEHDVVVTQFSTIGVEALMAGKPLVSMNWRSREEVIPFASSGVAELSTGPGDLLEAIDRAHDGWTARGQSVAVFLKRHLTGPMAAARVASLFPDGVS